MDSLGQPPDMFGKPQRHIYGKQLIPFGPKAFCFCSAGVTLQVRE